VNQGDAGPKRILDGAASAASDHAVPITAVDAAGLEWATGGTAAMTARASYPDPFTALPNACAVTCELTQGPCYSSQSEEIRDISYGYDGLPMRMYLRVLDESCKPIAGALVDVWHVGPTGKYSGNDSANEQVAFCTGNDTDFTSHLYFRGKQTTDANGVVYFDTCFPGWYSSRTIHVHMTISVAGQAYVTTQLGFEDALDDAIVDNQPLYKDRGKRDTLNTTDTVLPSTGLSDYLFEWKRMSDGAMLAYKTIILRSTLAETLCAPSGANGGPGGGGPGGPFRDGGPPPMGGFPPRDGGFPPRDGGPSPGI
jgi:protocatechuate 3,4-dioxygenase beta subunit